MLERSYTFKRTAANIEQNGSGGTASPSATVGEPSGAREQRPGRIRTSTPAATALAGRRPDAVGDDRRGRGFSGERRFEVTGSLYGSIRPRPGAAQACRIWRWRWRRCKADPLLPAGQRHCLDRGSTRGAHAAARLGLRQRRPCSYLLDRNTGCNKKCCNDHCASEEMGGAVVETRTRSGYACGD